MAKIKIGTKLFITYFFILSITFTLTSVLFIFLSEQYLIKEAKRELRNEGQVIVGLVKNLPLSDASIREKLVNRRELKIAGSIIEAKVIILNKDRKLIFTNLKDGERVEVQKLLKNINNIKTNGYITEKIPILTPQGDTKGFVVLLTEIKDLKGIRRLFSSTQLISFSIAGLISLVIAWFVGRSLNKPLKKLMNYMNNFSLRGSNSQELHLKTGDEIEELANCFNQMANKLKRIDEQQIKFLQNVSHELKTPLMSIQGYAEAIKDGVIEGKETEESLDIIIEESNRLKKIVEELIFLSKLENTDEVYSFQKTSIINILEKAIKSVKALADQKGIIINVENDKEYIGDYDEEKLKRAFINILGNCIRYAENTINITFQSIGKELEIKVIDDGIGFKEGEEKKVFDRLYKGEFGGTGIGLAITKAIIEGHKGKIIAYNSNNNGGAVFNISLPYRC